jgi:hypothetical protein
VPRPGVTVNVVDDVAPSGAAINTGTGFVVGVTEKGPGGVPTLVTSFRAYKDRFGSLAGGQDMYKAAYTFFNEGGLYLYVVRAVGTGAVAANATQAGWVRFDARGPGTWGNNLSVEIDPQTGTNPVTFIVTVKESGVIREVSSPMVGADVASWAGSSLVAATSLGTTYLADTAATATLTLAAGANGAAPTDAEITAALDTIGYAYGPGQVAIPGSRDPEQHAALAAHCEANHRVGLVDLPDTNDSNAQMVTIATLAAAGKGARQLLALGDVINYPGETLGVVWEVPYSGVQMGLVARADAGGDPSAVAAGANGASRLALGTKRAWTDAQRQDMNYAGITLGKMVNGQLRTYGYRVASGLSESNWVFWQESRVVMGVAHECGAAMEEFVFQTIDGRGKIFVRVAAALIGICQRYWQANALFGETAGEAFSVDTSYPGVNTVQTAAAGEIHATVRLKTSRVAEWVTLDIVKVPPTRVV